MSRIFLSHAGSETREAVALKSWLAAQRPELANEIFLDVDPRTGLELGEQWKTGLLRSTSRCESVICLLSSAWNASTECRVEYRTAEGLGKQILVARLEDIGDDITSAWQRCDLFDDGDQTQIDVGGGPPIRFNTAALHMLRRAIQGTGTGPENFVWPPDGDRDRVPYRGWVPFEDVDAGVFFGRDVAIARGLDELRAMRFRFLASMSGGKALFVVLGPSGAGKSSFLRAGLIPRLQRDDRRFMVLGTMRPERSALTGAAGFAAAIDSARRGLQLPGTPLGEIKRVCLHDADRVAELLAEVRAAAAARLGRTDATEASDGDSRPTLVLPVDQAEELFSSDAGPQAATFLTLLREVVAQLNRDEVGLIVAVSIRTDRYEVMQNHPDLDGIGSVIFDELKPMPVAQFTEVITGPAARATEVGRRLRIAPDLVQRLVDDAADGADTLPLLALTLGRLYTDFGGGGEITVSHYEAMGGMDDIVQNEVDDILPTDADARRAALKRLRSAFVPWLATVNVTTGQPMRRVAREADLPDTGGLIDALVEKRLLVKDERDGDVVVEVALESFLRQWKELDGWLRDERQNLIMSDDLERTATSWADHGNDPAWLLSGTRLVDAENLVMRPEFAARLVDSADFLTASRRAEDSRQRAEEDSRLAELRHARARTRYAVIVAAVAIAGTVAAVLGFVQATNAKNRSETLARQSIASRLLAEAHDMLDLRRTDGDIRAMQQILAANRLDAGTAEGGLRDATIARASTLKIIDAGAAVAGVTFSPDGLSLITGAEDGSAHAWEARTGRAVTTFDRPMRSLQNVTLSPDGHFIAASAADGTGIIWDIAAGAQVATLDRPAVVVGAIAFSRDDKRVAIADGGGAVQVWAADTGAPIGTPVDSGNLSLRSVAISPDGRRIAAGGDDRTTRIWDVDTGRLLATLTGHTDTVTAIAYSPDGHTLATASADHTARTWNPDTGQPVTTLTGHIDTVSAIAYSPDGHTLATASADHTARTWNPDAGRPVDLRATGRAQWVTGAAFSSDGRRVVTGSHDYSARIWDADSGRPLLSPLVGHFDGVTAVAFSTDGHRLATASYDQTAVIWDADTGKQLTTLEGHVRSIRSVVFSADGSRVVTASTDGNVGIWDAGTGQLITALNGDAGPVNAVAFSRDGSRVATAGADGTAVIWNSENGQSTTSLTGHTDEVTSIAFSPDGRRLVTGSSDHTARIWDAGSGRSLASLTFHTGGVTAVTFSPDGHRVATASSDHTARIWNAEDGRPIGGPLTGHPDEVVAVAFAPDGQRLASIDRDATIRHWPVFGSSNELCDKLTGNMSRRQWSEWVSTALDYVELCNGLPVRPD